MARREEPYERERAALLLHLVDVERLSFYDSEQWLRAWEDKADDLGRPRDSQGYWVEGLRWIVGQRKASGH